MDGERWSRSRSVDHSVRRCYPFDLKAMLRHAPDDSSRRTALGAEVPLRNATLRFMRWLWAVDHGLQSRSKRMRATLGVTGPQRLVVRKLGRSPGLSASELAAVLHLQPSTLTGVLQRWERLGLVTRTMASDDRRRISLRLTATGRDIDRERVGTIENAVRATLHRVSPEAVAATIDVLSQLVAELERDGRQGRATGGKRRRCGR